jgi:hypothetical protein
MTLDDLLNKLSMKGHKAAKPLPAIIKSFALYIGKQAKRIVPGTSHKRPKSKEKLRGSKAKYLVAKNAVD